jgi:pyridoxal phosphate enzyme (YggS family)
LRDPQPTDSLQDFASRLKAVRERIARAAERAGRDPASVRILGASKQVPAPSVRDAAAGGLADFGENRVQEAREKIDALGDLRGRVSWHLIGHLQSNKAREAARLFDWVHSIDSAAIAQALDRRAREEGRSLQVLVEVNASGEASKYGAEPDAVIETLRALDGAEALVPRGLMTIGPAGGDLAAARASFRRLAAALAEARVAFPSWNLDQLSMGMSEDLEVAVEEGATWVRVGRALFGDRPARGAR